MRIPTAVTLLATVVLAAALSLASEDAAPNKQPRVIGGSQGFVPFMAIVYRSITSTMSYSCGAVIISDRHILTAASCMYDSSGNLLPASGISVSYGTMSPLPSRNTLFRIASYRIHPDYTFSSDDSASASTYLADVAVLTTSATISSANGVRPIKIASSPNLAYGDTVYTAGWGATVASSTAPGSEVLMATKLTIGSTSTCSRYFSLFTGHDGSTICTVDMFNAPCEGDLGGPLYTGVNGALLGINGFRANSQSRGDCGGLTKPNYYTNVGYYASFIKAATGLSDFELFDKGVAPTRTTPTADPTTSNDSTPTRTTATTRPTTTPTTPATTGTNTGPIFGGNHAQVGHVAPGGIVAGALAGALVAAVY
ncbi:trypsin-like serine protease [Ramicandelaber brevisporus]|nr:trypsin-like serine protease [Ramicandelaber brevisporus]